MILLALLLICLTVVKCEIVGHPKNSEETIDMSKYCAPTDVCREGEHVMCMFYRPGHMGWLCKGGSSIVVTQHMAELMVDMANEFRARIASGNETGMDGELLGQAYGMRELVWHEELALFARVWADQCTRRYDYCRSTEEFKTPSQLISTTRFTYPEWTLTIRTDDDAFPDADIPRLTLKKVKYAIKSIMKHVYLKKDTVSKSIMVNLPDFSDINHIQPFVGYLTMINVNATYMGCGMSYYVDYYTKIQGMEDILSNVVLLVCNFSESLQEGSQLIENKPPNSTEKCGCPPGTREGKDCLCIPIKADEDLPKEPIEDPDYVQSEICDANDPNCQSSVIILPIITVENAPSEELFKVEDSDPQQSNVISRKYFDKHSLQPSAKHKSGKYLNAINQNGENVKKQNLPSQNQQVQYRKDSIFTRASKFELPKIHRQPTSKITIKKNTTTKNTLQDIATAYLESQRSKEAKNRKPTIIGVAELSTKLPKNEMEINKNDIETDNKLLKLLDNLEKEVKNVHSNSDIKEKIHAKIRKIYGNFFDGHEIIAKTKSNKYSHKNREYTIRNKFVTNEIDDDVLEHTDLQKRQQNSIMQYEDPIYEHYDIFDYNESPYDHLDRSYDNYYKRRDGSNLDKEAINHYYVHDAGDLLRAKKRKYYQQKLENIETQLNNLRTRKHHNDNAGNAHSSARLSRPVRNREIAPTVQVESLYSPILGY